jgi:replicative DNA helicase
LSDPAEGDREGAVLRSLRDPRAEQDLIVALLANPHLVQDVLEQLEPDDLFTKPTQVMLRAISALHFREEEVGPLTVTAKALEIDKLFDRVVLIDWMARVDSWGSVPRLVDHLLELSNRRRLNNDLRATLTDLHSGGSKAVVLADALAGRLQSVGQTATSDLVLPTALDIVSRTEEDVPWLIPGLLYRQDALIMVAGEGSGKSLLARQIALCGEAGLHPFTRADVPPIRVLTIDLENKRRAMTDSFRLALAAVRTVRPGFKPEGRVWEQPSGLNLLGGQDQRRFIEAIRSTKPDLVMLGPLYKLYRVMGNTKEDATALELAAFLDDVRARYDFGLWIEAHAPFGSGNQRDLRPYGTTVWQRWAEYGKNFYRNEKSGRLVVGSFRGDRTRVYWPKELVIGEKNFPFTGDYGDRLDLRIYGWPQERSA